MTRTRNQEASKLDQTIGSKTFTLCTITQLLDYYSGRDNVYNEVVLVVLVLVVQIYIYIYATEIKTIRILRDKIQSRDRDMKMRRKEEN